MRAVLDVSSHDPGAKAAEIARVFLPDAARGTGDDDDLALDIHLDLLERARAADVTRRNVGDARAGAGRLRSLS